MRHFVMLYHERQLSGSQQISVQLARVKKDRTLHLSALFMMIALQPSHNNEGAN